MLNLDDDRDVCFTPTSSDHTGGNMAGTRITRLTAHNVLALREIFPDAIASGDLLLTATTAEWPNHSALTALTRLDGAMGVLPSKGHPRASLHAVIRKLEKLGHVHEGQTEIPIDDDAPAWRDEEDPPTEYVSIARQVPEDAGPVKPMDPTADFLLDQNWSNLFEETSARPGHFGPFRCKGCGDIIDARDRERHHKRHKESRTMAKTSTPRKSSKPQKPKAADQGFPKAYLGENGNFRPGMDARAKSDLVAVMLGEPNKNALAKFTPAQAEELLKARGWMGFVQQKQDFLATKAARQEQAKADKAEKVRAAALAKQEKAGKADSSDGEQTLAQAAAADGDEVKPDPKPASRSSRKRNK